MQLDGSAQAPQYPRAPKKRRPVPPARSDEEQFRRAAWTTFWMLAVGKLIIMIVLAFVGWVTLPPFRRTLQVVVLLNWSWIALALIMIVGPALYWLRLWRVRRKRAALIRAEWRVD